MFCYLTDSTSALFKIMLEGEPGRAFNMGNHETEISIRELARIMVSLFPDRKLRVEQITDQHSPGYLRTSIDRACPDTTLLRGLGWSPTIGIEEGFKRTVLSYL